MPLNIRVETRGFDLSPTDDRRVEHGLRALERRLGKRPDPSAILVLTHFPACRVMEAGLRVQLGPLGAHLIARETAETAERTDGTALVGQDRAASALAFGLAMSGQGFNVFASGVGQRVEAKRRHGRATTTARSARRLVRHARGR